MGRGAPGRKLLTILRWTGLQPLGMASLAKELDLATTPGLDRALGVLGSCAAARALEELRGRLPIWHKLRNETNDQCGRHNDAKNEFSCHGLLPNTNGIEPIRGPGVGLIDQLGCASRLRKAQGQ